MYRQRIEQRHAARPDLSEQRVEVPVAIRDELAERRRTSGVSNVALCSAIGIRQPCTFYAWERGIQRPTVTHFRNYVQALGADVETIMDSVAVGESRLQHTWSTQYRGSGANECVPGSGSRM